MIIFLDGRVDTLGIGYVDLDVNHVGYRVYVSDLTLRSLRAGEDVRLYTYQHVREDGLFLFGFATLGDRQIFERLISVSGVGPKLAMQMLGALPAPAVVAAIRQEDAQTLCGLPGIGKKTAQRMILELKDKLDDLPMSTDSIYANAEPPKAQVDVADDVTTALIALGYRQKEAMAATEHVLQNQRHTVETAIKAALTWLYANQSELNA